MLVDAASQATCINKQHVQSVICEKGRNTNIAAKSHAPCCIPEQSRASRWGGPVLAKQD